MICPLHRSCCIPYSCRTHVISDVAPSPVVLHVRPSHLPYNFITDVAFPSPVVLHARPSHVSYNLILMSHSLHQSCYMPDHLISYNLILMSHSLHQSCYMSGHLISLTTLVLMSRSLPQSCYMPGRLVPLITSVLMSHSHLLSCYIPSHLTRLTKSVPTSYRLPCSPIPMQTALVFRAVKTQNCWLKLCVEALADWYVVWADSACKLTVCQLLQWSGTQMPWDSLLSNPYLLTIHKNVFRPSGWNDRVK
jgi:hypothetical protein